MKITAGNNDTTVKQPVLENGIQRVALSFSGGGFRAAAFTLGCASFLYKVNYNKEPLLHKVKFISSASGGSITNLVLSAMLRNEVDFPTIYKHLLEQLDGTNLMDKVFKVLNDHVAWKDRPGKSRNLINAFALVYDKELFDGATFEVLSKPVPEGRFVIEETCVNATEFTNGMNFRWGNGTGKVGNKFLCFTQGEAGAAKIRLGDILASSSCFPGGFEPIMFPVDFANEEVGAHSLRSGMTQLNNFTETTDTTLNTQKGVNFGFMDGGIDDNQGIYAFLLADDRVDGGFDLYFPCDVSSNYLNDPFTYPKPVEGVGYDRTASDLLRDVKEKVKWYIGVFAVLLVLGLLGAIFGFWRLVSLLVTGAASLALAAPFLAVYLLKKWFKDLAGTLFPSARGSNSWGIIFNKYKSSLLQLKLGQILQMLLARATSVLLLADTIYLKRIRQLSYSNLYASKANDVYEELIRANNASPQVLAPGKLWTDHIAQTTIYKLATKNDAQLQVDLRGDGFQQMQVSATDTRPVYSLMYPISLALRRHADKAAAMDTTLWFDENQQKDESLKSLLIAGQATMCFNLLRTAYRFGNTEQSWKDFRADLIAHWEHFQREPDWLYNEQ